MPSTSLSNRPLAALLSQPETDPVTATYSVYLTSAPPKQDSPRSLLIQYPDRLGLHPYGPSDNNTPLNFRIKPSTGVIELDVPLNTSRHYNAARGAVYGDALHKSRIISVGGSHGLAGGFNTGPGGRVVRQNEDGDIDMNSIPHHGELDEERELKTQTLGGKIAKPSGGDPVYMLGSFRGSELHLTPLDSLVQVRPQLHHLDAADEVLRASIKPLKKGEQSEKPSGPETRAVELKVKTADEKNADRARKRTNAEMLSEIQLEPWQNYKWHDESSSETISQFSKSMYHQHSSSSEEDPRPFASAITPTTYLDAISAPRIDPNSSFLPQTAHTSRSHLGLMGKVRGRERERRRRKKNDADRRAAAAAEAEEATRRSTSEAVERGEMRAEDAEDLIRQASEEAAAQAGEAGEEEEDSSDDRSDSSSGGDDDDDDPAVLEIDEDRANTTTETRPSKRRPSTTKGPAHEISAVSSGSKQQAPSTTTTAKRGPGRPKRADTAKVKSEPMVIDE